MAKTEKNRLTILNILRDAGRPLTSAQIAGTLRAAGFDMSDRTVRLYLKQMDQDGATIALGRRGRQITQAGVSEAHAQQLMQRVGYLSAKIDQLTYQMTFDLQRRSGNVVVNTSLVEPGQLAKSLGMVCKVFADGFAMGNRLALLRPGETVGTVTVPDGRIGFCTVCSITVNGVLLKHGIPTASRFGGLLEVRDGLGSRFVELIHYDGTSIDPLEVFIRSGMTDYTGAIRDGNGRIGASFRELPGDARQLVLHLGERLEEVGLNAFMEVGLPSQPVMGVPVSAGRLGVVVIGGLNPIAILEEAGHRIFSRALSGLMEYNRLFHYGELAGRIKDLL